VLDTASFGGGIFLPFSENLYSAGPESLALITASTRFVRLRSRECPTTSLGGQSTRTQFGFSHHGGKAQTGITQAAVS
jgi:hypothetical protein